MLGGGVGGRSSGEEAAPQSACAVLNCCVAFA